MNQLAILGLFCEDIREEAHEQFTLIGLMSDNVSVTKLVRGPKEAPVALPTPAQGKVLSRICIFARANFDPKDPLKEIKLTLTFPEGQTVDLGGASPDTIAHAKKEAIAKGNPLASIIMRANLDGIKLDQIGVMRLDADVSGKKYLLAAMNFQRSAPTSST